MTQLQDVVHAAAGFLFNTRQFVNQLGGGYQRLFTNNVAPQPQASSYVCVVQVVRAADRYIVECRCRIAFELLGVFLKALELGEKFALWGNTVDDAYRVVDVIGYGQTIAGVFDGAHVARGDVAGGTNKGEVFHFGRCKLESKNSKAFASQCVAIKDALEIANHRLMFGLAVRH